MDSCADGGVGAGAGSTALSSGGSGTGVGADTESHAPNIFTHSPLFTATQYGSFVSKSYVVIPAGSSGDPKIARSARNVFVTISFVSERYRTELGDGIKGASIDMHTPQARL